MSFNIDIGTRLLTRAALALLFGLSADVAMAQSVRGTATYRERIALPAAAVLEALIEDVSRTDAPAETIARTRVGSPGNPPIAFAIAYDPAKILADHRYVVRARILLDELKGDSDATGKRVAVFAAGVQGSLPSISPGLAGTSWQLVKFQGGNETTLTPDDRAKYTIQIDAGGSLTARIDCNRGRGTWKSSGPNQLQFGPLALTRAKCPTGSLHDQIVKQWGFIRSYVIRDGHLFLSLMADGGIYEFEPLPKTKP